MTTAHLTAARTFVRTLPSTTKFRVTEISGTDYPTRKTAIADLVNGTGIQLVGDASATIVALVKGIDLTLDAALQAAAESVGDGVATPMPSFDHEALLDLQSTKLYIIHDTSANEPVGWITIDASPAPKPAGTFEPASLSRINNVDLSLAVEIGRTQMPIRQLLALEPGAVIELDRSAGAPADILVNGKLIGHGEIIVIDQEYAVRLTRILDQQDSTN